MRHKGLKRVADYPKNDVEDDDDWNEVETTIKAWVIKKHGNIRADLQFKFKIEVAKTGVEESEPVRADISPIEAKKVCFS
jgi:hypothetical protein